MAGTPRGRLAISDSELPGQAHSVKELQDLATPDRSEDRVTRAVATPDRVQAIEVHKGKKDVESMLASMKAQLKRKPAIAMEVASDDSDGVIEVLSTKVPSIRRLSIF